MLRKRDSEYENEILHKIISEDSEIKKQHDLFKEEMRFKQILIDVRKQRDMTQKDVSAKSGLSQQAVSRLEKGTGGTLDTVIRYLDAIGYKLSVVKSS